jgi:hypothetical protein
VPSNGSQGIRKPGRLAETITLEGKRARHRTADFWLSFMQDISLAATW